MAIVLSRRGLLATASLTGIHPPRLLAATASAPITLTAVRRTLEVNGKPASVFGLHQPDGTPGVNLAPGERFQLQLKNAVGEPTIVHWHGQTPPPRQDGVAETGLVGPIAADATQAYDFAPRTGTHWMHSHQGLQEQQLLAAPLIVRDARDAGMQDEVVMLHDFSFRDPAEILAGLTNKSAAGQATSAMAGMNMPGMTMPGMAGGMNQAAVRGQAMDLNDVDFDAYLANDRTLDDPQVIRAERRERIRLRLINGASSTAFWVDLGVLQGSVVAVDGDPVHPVPVRRFPIAQAQRVDVIIRIPPAGGAFPILALREGERERTGFILATPGAPIRRVAGLADRAAGATDMSLERTLRAASPLPARRADIVHRVTLDGSMAPYAWSINGHRWAEHTPILVSRDKRVELDLVNTTPMAHPMHLHGHHFQVLALNGVAFSGAMRDTVLVPGSGHVRIAFDADNPGRWLFHCHNLYHMATGMMTEVVYSDFT
jgi:FtsP/CotA-like multicopper oxidase with cupredoxin domain